jgi:replicative DNA helicase
MSIRDRKAAQGSGGQAPTVPDSERAALGAAIRDPDSAELVVTELCREDFYTVRTQSIFQAITGLMEDGHALSPVSVAERSGLPKTDVEELLSDSNGIGSSQLKTLISEIKRIGQLRTIYNACLNASSQIGKDSKLDQVLEVLEKGLYRADRDGSDDAKDGSEVMRKVVDDFIARQKIGGGPEISSGLRDLDRALVGLRPGKLGVIAARPSMGKTALASTIRRSVLAQGYGVIEFALEMSAEELLERELAFQAQLNLRKVLSAKEVSEDELIRVGAATGSVLQGRWFIDDRTYSIAGIRRRAKVVAGRMARAGIALGCVIIDYLQLAGDNGEGREQSIAATSRGCKFLAKELGCTVLALSQLNRSCEYREDRRPLMSDLRESGAIEQDADWVGFVYREHMYDNSFPPEETEFIIRKQRSGPTGTIRLQYNPKLVSFSDRDIQASSAIENNEQATAPTNH